MRLRTTPTARSVRQTNTRHRFTHLDLLQLVVEDGQPLRRELVHPLIQRQPAPRLQLLARVRALAVPVPEDAVVPRGVDDLVGLVR